MSDNQRTEYWRSLAELEQTPEFEQFLHREFPEAAAEAPTGVSRRRWLQVMGASLALGAGASGCRYPQETIAPFASRPENRVPGETKQFATTLYLAGKVCPVVATSYDGRPIKIDGNKQHTLVQGGDTFAHSNILHLYDPDRSREVRQKVEGVASSKAWSDFAAFWQERSGEFTGGNSARLAILHGENASPTVLRQMNKVAEKFPQARWFKYESAANNSAQGVQKAFGQSLRPILHVDKADILVSIDADFLSDHATSDANSQQFASRRDPDADAGMNRLYVIESLYTTTGLAADHRLAVPTSKMASFVADLEKRINERGDDDSPQGERPEDKHERFITALVNDLVAHRGNSLLIGGDYLDADTQARVWRINDKLGNIGETVQFVEVPPTERENIGDLAALVESLSAGEVDALVVLGGNPVYDAMGRVDFAAAMEKAATRIFYGEYENETSALCDWHLPATHGLEQWGDFIAFDGSYCTAQPLIDPIFDGKDLVQVLSQLHGDVVEKTDEAVRETVQELFSSYSTEAAWARALHDGFIQGSASSFVDVKIAGELNLAEADPASWLQAAESELEVVIRPSRATYDGRYANNGWLQELPDPITKVTWDNVVTVGVSTAKQLNISQGELVKIDVGGASVTLPAYLQPGQAPGTLGVVLGYGRTHAGMVGGNVDANIEPVGSNVSSIRTAQSPFLASEVTIQPTGETYRLATTQDHHAIDTLGMEEIGHRVGKLVREGTLEQYEEHPDFAEHMVHHPPLESLWQDWSYEGHAWAMSIDLSKCTGCNACVIACQSENNVPIVGKEAVSRGREMHWIRVDRYFSGDVDDPAATTQPVTCHHCETAPCESVCPVAATIHSSEGLNDMVYNRCIGTRYCGNNCPYKVRRFNYLDWRADDYRFEEANKELAKLVHNPEVTVRNRGVMEKCTFCVQRIQNTKIEARAERRPIGPNEIKVACQEACSAQAIQFGDRNNPESNVRQAHDNPRAYSMLAELNVKPRLKYLARIRNPHPWMAPEIPEHSGHGHDEEHGSPEHGQNAHDHATDHDH